MLPFESHLEVRKRLPATPSRKPPLLFVHGGNLAAWCWDEHFLNFFADKGFRAVAVSLRGHGASNIPWRCGGERGEIEKNRSARRPV